MIELTLIRFAVVVVLKLGGIPVYIFFDVVAINDKL